MTRDAWLDTAAFPLRSALRARVAPEGDAQAVPTNPKDTTNVTYLMYFPDQSFLCAVLIVVYREGQRRAAVNRMRQIDGQFAVT